MLILNEQHTERPTAAMLGWVRRSRPRLGQPALPGCLGTVAPQLPHHRHKLSSLISLSGLEVSDALSNYQS